MQYDGGKNGEGTYQRIINQIPPHRVYVELFAGSAAVLRKKRPAEESIVCDLDPGAIAALREEDLPPNTQIVTMDALELLERTSIGRGWFLYADPPYLPSTRRGGRVYDHELTVDQHRRLLRRLKALDGPMVMLSGYWSDLYARELRGWRTDHFDVMTRGGPATEWLWMNYAAPVELHDYRYLGEGFRQRERIRRQQRRWAGKLARMDRLQRQALLAAIADRHAGNGEDRVDPISPESSMVATTGRLPASSPETAIAAATARNGEVAGRLAQSDDGARASSPDPARAPGIGTVTNGGSVYLPSPQ